MDLKALEPNLATFLGRQRWFSGGSSPISDVRFHETEVLRDGVPALVWTLVVVDDVFYQVPIGIRPSADAEAVLVGQESFVIGALAEGDDALVAYDALIDPQCCVILLEAIAGLQASRARPVGAEQSNSSIVFDDSLIMKIFRRPVPGSNPEVEIALALDGVGFNHIPAPASAWRRQGMDLAIVQEFLSGGVEGWALALTSLRDVFGIQGGSPPPGMVAGLSAAASGDATSQLLSGGQGPAESTPDCVVASAGADFAAEAERLGTMTARMHEAMVSAFGLGDAQPSQWVASIRADIESLILKVGTATVSGIRISDLQDLCSPLLDELADVSSAGKVIRVHGDYHLGQVMRSDVGWFVLDFEGEPARPIAERNTLTSSLKDVAGMLRSLHYANAVARGERGSTTEASKDLGEAWQRRNRDAFVKAYMAHVPVEILPKDMYSTMVVLTAFELEKAIYEMDYEISMRPAWAWIPAEALEELTGRDLKRSVLVPIDDEEMQ